jgi:hypothetical protein
VPMGGAGGGGIGVCRHCAPFPLLTNLPKRLPLISYRNARPLGLVLRVERHQRGSADLDDDDHDDGLEQRCREGDCDRDEGCEGGGCGFGRGVGNFVAGRCVGNGH